MQTFYQLFKCYANENVRQGLCKSPEVPCHYTSPRHSASLASWRNKSGAMTLFITQMFSRPGLLEGRIRSHDTIYHPDVQPAWPPGGTHQEPRNKVGRGWRLVAYTINMAFFRMWDCTYCGKKFTTKYFLKKHRRLHTGRVLYIRLFNMMADLYWPALACWMILCGRMSIIYIYMNSVFK